MKCVLVVFSETESLVSEEDLSSSMIMADVDYPPGTKLNVRYGRPRNIKIYDAKVMEVRMGEDRQLRYSVHYSGWNVRLASSSSSYVLTARSSLIFYSIHRVGVGQAFSDGKTGKSWWLHEIWKAQKIVQQHSTMKLHIITV